MKNNKIKAVPFILMIIRAVMIILRIMKSNNQKGNANIQH